jgi:hypothetical protein
MLALRSLVLSQMSRLPARSELTSQLNAGY